MTANATISGGTLHSYPPARGIKNEHDAPDFPSQLMEGYPPRIHSAAHNAGYGEGNRTGYVPFPVYPYPSQLPISPPLSREGTRADTKDNMVASSQYPSEVSPLDYSHTGGAMPSEEPNHDVLEDFSDFSDFGDFGDFGDFSDSSEPPSKKRKTQKKKKRIPVLPEHLSHFKSSLSQIAAAKGFNRALLKDAKRYVTRSTQVRHREELKPDGTAKRTLNCFFLYRKIYHCVALTLVSGNRSEQQASLLCAVSWYRESERFQRKFEKMAKKDSANQLIAYPDYKYAPSKSGQKDDKRVKGRASTKTGRVTRKRKPASKVKELRNFSEEVLQQAIDEQQSLPAEAVHPQPYWTPVAVETYPAPCPGELAVYHGPHLYQTQTHYITYDNGYSQSRISSPVVVYGLYEGTGNPDVNYNENFIDPVLLQHQSESNLHHCSLATQQRSQPAPIERSRAETGIPSWDHEEPYRLFRERKGDCWEVKELTKRSEFDDWMLQTDTEAQAQEV